MPQFTCKELWTSGVSWQTCQESKDGEKQIATLHIRLVNGDQDIVLGLTSWIRGSDIDKTLDYVEQECYLTDEVVPSDADDVCRLPIQWSLFDASDEFELFENSDLGLGCGDPTDLDDNYLSIGDLITL